MKRFVHPLLIDRGIEAGYLSESDKAGICQGISQMWLEAMLVHQEAQFNQRISRILSDKNIFKKIEKVKAKVQQHIKITTDEYELLNIQAFYESIQLYLNPTEH